MKIGEVNRPTNIYTYINLSFININIYIYISDMFLLQTLRKSKKSPCCFCCNCNNILNRATESRPPLTHTYKIELCISLYSLLNTFVDTKFNILVLILSSLFIDFSLLFNPLDCFDNLLNNLTLGPLLLLLLVLVVTIRNDREEVRIVLEFKYIWLRII